MRDTITIPADLFVFLMNRNLPDARSTMPVEDQVELAKADKYVALAQLPRLHIAGSRWFSKHAGNTYHKTRIYANGKLVYTSEQHYGYGDQYLTTALDWLAAMHPELVPGWQRGKNVTIYLREEIQGTWAVADVERERDL